MRMVVIVFYVLLIIIGVSFAALNAASVQVNLYVIKIDLPISVLMIVTLAVGVGIGFCLFVFRYWRLKAEHRRIKNQLKLTEREVINLRSIPLQDQH
jgi:putative membrane protein